MEIEAGLHTNGSALAGSKDRKEALLDRLARVSLTNVRTRRISIRGEDLVELPASGQLVLYLVLAGECLFSAGEGSHSLDARSRSGDIICFPQGARGTLSTLRDRNMATVALRLPRKADDVVLGYGKVAVRLIEIRAEAPKAMLLSRVMPALLPARAVSSENAPLVEALIRLARGEQYSRKAAALTCEVLYLKALDHVFDCFGASELIDQSMRCPPVARAISLIQMSPQIRWTIDRLAAEAGLSRSALLRRFSAIVGSSPTVFIREHRLTAARELLETSDDTISQIAERVGFESPSAFSAAFRRRFGVAPSAIRAVPKVNPAAVTPTFPA